ncbi:MAG: S1 RNA-binding domain-containing protein, partial [Planctomycetota bacterium]|nr:S1 RNA-binding domain-containing protein [Planctomycetota bacterium]
MEDNILIKDSTITRPTGPDFKTFMADRTFLNIPKISDVVKGIVIAIGKNEVRIDIDRYRTGVVRGREIIDPSREYSDVEIGDEIEATVIDLENENGDVELSFRFAGHRKAWDKLKEMFRSGEPVEIKVTEASKGGLLVRLSHVTGFLPVSQLAPENYPRVAGGDKGKILEKLKQFVGKGMEVRVLDVNEQEEKLIVSEKAVWEEKQRSVISKYAIGDLVEGEVSALAEFGAFVKFDILEGLVHISEIAWQRIDHPKNILKVDETVKAEIIGIEGSKIFLSMKKLIDDPWQSVGERYRVGQKVIGTVLKVNPFGFFVELDPEIHGLAHISELSHKPVDDPHELAKAGDEVEFMIVSIEPEQHRLGLSLKALEDKPEPEEEPKADDEENPEADEKKGTAEETKKGEASPSAEAAVDEPTEDTEVAEDKAEEKAPASSVEAVGDEPAEESKEGEKKKK